MNDLKLLFLYVILGLAACVSRDPISPATETDWVSLDTYGGPFCGRCDTTKIIVHYDGSVFIEQGRWLLGQRFWHTKRRAAELDESQVSNFLTHLQRYRPQGVLDLGDPEHCDEYLFDVSGMRVSWSDEFGDDELNAYFGCYRQSLPNFAGDLKASLGTLSIPSLEIPEWGWKQEDNIE